MRSSIFVNVDVARLNEILYSINVENLHKGFGDIVAVNDVSFQVEKGEVFGFLGPNGAGKTTTIRMLTGILGADRGSVIIEGIDIKENGIQAKMNIGVIPETGNVYVDLDPEQNLALAGRFYGMSKIDIRTRTDELLKSLGLYERRKDPVRTFSKGMRQRISIACAVMHKPHILFLDEPTEGLDVHSKRIIYATINELNQAGSTIFLTTHNIEEANVLCNRVGIINKGKMVAIDSPERLRGAFEKTQSIELTVDKAIGKESLANCGALKIEAFGDKLRLYTDDPDKTIKRVVAMTEKEGLRILALNIRGPSLEEVFVKLTGGK